MNILLICVAFSYVFSGYICCLAFLGYLDRQSALPQWKCCLAALASLLIIVSWPAWMITEAIRLLAEQDDKESLQDNFII